MSDDTTNGRMTNQQLLVELLGELREQRKEIREQGTTISGISSALAVQGTRMDTVLVTLRASESHAAIVAEKVDHLETDTVLLLRRVDDLEHRPTSAFTQEEAFEIKRYLSIARDGKLRSVLTTEEQDWVRARMRKTIQLDETLLQLARASRINRPVLIISGIALLISFSSLVAFLYFNIVH